MTKEEKQAALFKYLCQNHESGRVSRFGNAVTYYLSPTMLQHDSYRTYHVPDWTKVEEEFGHLFFHRKSAGFVFSKQALVTLGVYNNPCVLIDIEHARRYMHMFYELFTGPVFFFVITHGKSRKLVPVFDNEEDFRFWEYFCSANQGQYVGTSSCTFYFKQYLQGVHGLIGG